MLTQVLSALTVATHAGRIVHNDAAGAVTYTLPAVNALLILGFQDQDQA